MVVWTTALCISQPPTHTNMAGPQISAMSLTTLVPVGTQTWHAVVGDDVLCYTWEH